LNVNAIHDYKSLCKYNSLRYTDGVGGVEMELGLICLSIGIALAGFCVGDGLKNFKNPESKSLMDYLDETDEHELIKASDVHHFMGISKEDAKVLLREHESIPHILINQQIYFPKSKLRKWLLNIGEE